MLTPIQLVCSMHQTNFFKIIEYIFLIALCGLSGYLMYGVLDQFFSGKTGICQSKEPIKELPTITFCFTKPNSRKTEYEYGKDFKILYNNIILEEGENINYTREHIVAGTLLNGNFVY